ncbi:MAG TPA: transposase [Candidatus Methanoperedens sp.]|nr:transposase [Candidatus Methanoperedens sp.]
MQLTEKIRIYPTIEQEYVLWHLSEQCRLIYNFALAERKRQWELNNLRFGFQVFPWGKPEWIGYTKQQNDLPSIKEKYPQYACVNSKVLQMVLRTLDADYRSFMTLRTKGDKDAHPPGFKSKNNFTTMVYNQSGFRLQDGRIALAQYYRKDVSLVFDILADYIAKNLGRIYQVVVSYDRGKYYLSIVHEVPEKPYEDNGLYQAIDLGITKTVTAVNMQGKFFEATNPRPDKFWNPQTDAIQSRRDHCKKGSNKWKHLHKTMNKKKRKCSNQIKDHQHKLSRKMVDNTRANTFIVGDLDVKEMPKSKKASSGLNRSTQNNGYLSQFVRFLTYKAALAGKKVIEIDERNTSKRCCVCEKKHDMPLWKRIMDCDCGNLIDRDRNSTISIMLRFLSQNAMWTGYQQFVGNLRNTGLLVPWSYSTGASGTLEIHSQEAPCESMG